MKKQPKGAGTLAATAALAGKRKYNRTVTFLIEEDCLRHQFGPNKAYTNIIGMSPTEMTPEGVTAGLDVDLMELPPEELRRRGEFLPPNPRDGPNKRGGQSRTITKEAINKNGDENIFVAKANGLEIVAKKVTIGKKIQYRGRNYREVRVLLGITGGIYNGGHVYYALLASIKDYRRMEKAGEKLPENHVKVNITTGMSVLECTGTAAARNTMIVLKKKSLMNREGYFDSIKRYMLENDLCGKNLVLFGEAPLDVARTMAHDISEWLAVSFMANSKIYPNIALLPKGVEDAATQPTDAFRRPSTLFTEFKKNPDSVNMMLPVMKDLMKIYEAIRYFGPKLTNKIDVQTKLSEKRSVPYIFPLLPGEVPTFNRLHKALAFPLFAGIVRNFVEFDDAGVPHLMVAADDIIFGWKHVIGPELIPAMEELFERDFLLDQTGMGSSSAVWATVHSFGAALADGVRQQNKSKSQKGTSNDRKLSQIAGKNARFWLKVSKWTMKCYDKTIGKWTRPVEKFVHPDVEAAKPTLIKSTA